MKRTHNILVLVSLLTLGAHRAEGRAPDESVADALAAVDAARKQFVTAEFHGELAQMASAADARDRGLLDLDVAIVSPETIRELPWPLRTEWLRLALRERRLDWSRQLLEALGGEPPPEGSASRGPSALAMGLTALRLLELDPEDDSAFLNGNPDTPLLDVAREAFSAAAYEDFLLRDEAVYRLWELSDGEGDTTGALAWADSLVQLDPRSTRIPEVRMTRARAALRAGDPSRAVAEARIILSENDTPELRWLLVEGYGALAVKREAVRHLKSLIGNFGTDPYAVRAWERLLSIVAEDSTMQLTPIERIRLGGFLLPNERSDAVEVLQNMAADESLSPEERDEAALTLCRYFYRAKRYDDAVPLLMTLQKSADAKAVEEANLTLARIYRNTGRLGPMARQYDTVFKLDGPESARAVWEWSRELESAGKWNDAESMYTKGLDSFRGTRRYRNALFRRGFVRVRLGRLEKAAEDFRAAYRESKTATDEEQALFWLARTLDQLGRDEEARQAATAGMASVKPAGAYGVLLRERFPREAAGDDAAAGDTTDVYPSLLDQFDVSSWPARVKHHYLRGLGLTELGDVDGGRKEWERAYAYAGRNVAAVEGLAVTAASYHMYPQGVRWARRAADLLPLGHPDVVGFERLSYPVAYYGDVVRESERHGVHPFSVWALMRQESLYDPVAVSRVGALGLMQIMPATLTRITNEAGIPPMSKEGLFRPETNIALGTRFFAERLEEFEGRMLPTLAGYNAGEGKAREWLDRADGDDQEIFIECIGFPETYDYVRRILWLNWVYEDYYGEEPASTPAGNEAR